MRKLHLAILVALLLPLPALAQSDSGGEVSLGDLARSLRKSKPPEPAHTVIDNDNMHQVMEQVETQRLNGKPSFSLNGSGKDFQMSSPDGTCSLSFSAEATAIVTDPYVAVDLPQAELVKLDGPAAIDGDTLMVSVYNGTGWKLQEITVGLTIVRSSDSTASYSGSARLLPASVDTSSSAQKRPDLTVLYHIKGSAAPFSSAVFREKLGATLAPEQDWHWAIVQARGLPPATSAK